MTRRSKSRIGRMRPSLLVVLFNASRTKSGSCKWECHGQRVCSAELNKFYRSPSVKSQESRWLHGFCGCEGKSKRYPCSLMSCLRGHAVGTFWVFTSSWRAGIMILHKGQLSARSSLVKNDCSGKSKGVQKRHMLLFRQFIASFMQNDFGLRFLKCKG